MAPNHVFGIQAGPNGVPCNSHVELILPIYCAKNIVIAIKVPQSNEGTYMAIY